MLFTIRVLTPSHSGNVDVVFNNKFTASSRFQHTKCKWPIIIVLLLLPPPPIREHVFAYFSLQTMRQTKLLASIPSGVKCQRKIMQRDCSSAHARPPRAYVQCTYVCAKVARFSRCTKAPGGCGRNMCGAIRSCPRRC